MVATPKPTSKPPATPKAKGKTAPKAQAQSVGRTLNLKPMPDNANHPEDIRPHPWRFTAGLSLSVALPVGLAVAASLGLQLDRDISLYLLLVSVLATCVSLVMSQAALMYGLSKNQDGRISARRQWWQAARSGFMDLLNLDLMWIIGFLLIIAAGFGALQATSLLPTDSWYRPVSLVAANILLAWVLIGLFTARRMAIPAVVVGGLTAWQGLKIGWRAYLRFGGKLAVASTETVLIRVATSILIAAMVLALVRIGSQWDTLSQAVAAGAMTAGGIFVLFVVSLQVELKLWLAQYRFWLPATHPAGRAKLLAGRRGR